MKSKFFEWIGQSIIRIGIYLNIQVNTLKYCEHLIGTNTLCIAPNKHRSIPHLTPINAITKLERT